MRKQEAGTIVATCNACKYTFSTHAKASVQCRRCRSPDVDRWRPSGDA